MTPRSLTVGLIAGNAIAWAGLVMIALYQFGMLGFSRHGEMPEIATLAPTTVIPPDSPRIDGRRNPFDLTGTHWKIGPAAASVTAESSATDIRGVLQLPGVCAVVTSQGAVRIGETMAGGKFSGIRGSKVIVEQQDGRQELDLPGTGEQPWNR